MVAGFVEGLRIDDHLVVGRRFGEDNQWGVCVNGLVRGGSWDIGLQKTGYISEAGQCLVMQARVAGRKLIMVFLDSAGKLSRLGDAERVRQCFILLRTLRDQLRDSAPAGASTPRAATISS